MTKIIAGIIYVSKLFLHEFYDIFVKYLLLEFLKNLGTQFSMVRKTKNRGALLIMGKDSSFF